MNGLNIQDAVGNPINPGDVVAIGKYKNITVGVATKLKRNKLTALTVATSWLNHNQAVQIYDRRITSSDDSFDDVLVVTPVNVHLPKELLDLQQKVRTEQAYWLPDRPVMSRESFYSKWLKNFQKRVASARTISYGYSSKSINLYFSTTHNGEKFYTHAKTDNTSTEVSIYPGGARICVASYHVMKNTGQPGYAHTPTGLICGDTLFDKQEVIDAILELEKKL